MGDYEALRQHLGALTENDFCALRAKLGYEIMKENGGVVEFLVETNGQRSLPRSWRQQITDEMMDWKEKDKAMWNRLCWIVQIESDAALSLRFARNSRIIAIIAVVISGLSFVLAVLK